MAPISARTRGGSEAGDLEQALETPFSEKRARFCELVSRLTVRSSFRPAQEIQHRGIGVRRPAHASGRRVWITVSVPKFSGQTEGTCGNLATSGGLGSEAEQAGGSDT